MLQNLDCDAMVHP